MVLSVVMLAHNHEKYIAQAIESVLMQQRNFDIELLVGEDCSTDNTREIIRSYEAKYPDIIKPVYYEQNVGMQQNAFTLLQKASGKYIADLEGDDYWTDPYKLQKQVDFLETHPDVIMCFTSVEVLDEIGLQQPDPFPFIEKNVITIADIIKSSVNFVPTCTKVYRNFFEFPLPTFVTYALSLDIAFLLLMADKNNFFYLDEKTAVYRQHQGGISKSAKHIRRGEEALFKLFLDFDKFSQGKYSQQIRERLLQMKKTILIYGVKDLKGVHKIMHIYRNLPGYFKYSEKVNIKELIHYHIIWFVPFIYKLIGKYSKKNL